MLGPVELVTLIAFCVPWADPGVAYALVMAGSGGTPWRITHADGRVTDAASVREALSALEAVGTASGQPNAPSYVGLMQVPFDPARDSADTGAVLLDKCANIAIGYQRYVAAWDAAAKYDKVAGPRTAIALNLYRTAQPLRQSPYATAAADWMGKPVPAKPAAMTDPIYHKVLAEWSAGIAARHGARGGGQTITLLADAAQHASRSRQGK